VRTDIHFSPLQLFLNSLQFVLKRTMYIDLESCQALE
jgi:hypothetical protein